MEYTAESSKRTREDCYEQGTGNRFVQKKSAEIYGRRLLAWFGGRLLPHVSSAYAATEGGAKALVVYYSRSGNTRAVAEAIHAAVGGDIVDFSR